MIYTKKSPALVIIGIIMVLWGWLNERGAIDGLQSTLQKSAYSDHQKITEKYNAELRFATETAQAEGKPVPEIKKPDSKFDQEKAFQTKMSYIFGAAFILIGLFILVWKPTVGNLDYYISTVPGLAFILIIAYVVRWGLDPMFGNWGKAAMDAGTLSWEAIGIPSWDFAKILNLNHVVLGIVSGIIIVNVVKIPTWAANGVRAARLFLKAGVILLGTLYSFAELGQLGLLSFGMIAVFVLGSVGMVLYMGRRMRCPNTMTGVLSAGLGVCGVSATVAAAPVVQAKSGEIAYTIGTILLWGVGCMFLFPTIGHLLDMSPVQFGAWAGTGILNSAQVAGAALAFDPKGIETLKVAEIFNITRVLFLPIIVLWLATWYMKHEQDAVKVNLREVLVAKFPLFVLGFIAMFLLSSTGAFSPAGHYQGEYFSSSEVKEEKLLKPKEVRALEAELPKMRTSVETQALQDLIANRKMMTREQSQMLRSVAKIEGLDAVAAGAITNALKAATHKSKIISYFRSWLDWLFAFGLIGLGMQITVASIKQAGGKPLVIGSVVGTVKAVGALIVVLALTKFGYFQQFV